MLCLVGSLFSGWQTFNYLFTCFDAFFEITLEFFGVAEQEMAAANIIFKDRKVLFNLLRLPIGIRELFEVFVDILEADYSFIIVAFLRLFGAFVRERKFPDGVIEGFDLKAKLFSLTFLEDEN